MADELSEGKVILETEHYKAIRLLFPNGGKSNGPNKPDDVWKFEVEVECKCCGSRHIVSFAQWALAPSFKEPSFLIRGAKKK